MAHSCRQKAKTFVFHGYESDKKKKSKVCSVLCRLLTDMADAMMSHSLDRKNMFHVKAQFFLIKTF